MERVGERLRILLKDRGLSQAAFAKLLNVARPTVSMWLNGTKRPGRDTLAHISKTMDVSMDWLVGNVEIDEPITIGQGELLKDIDLPLSKIVEKYDLGDDLTEEEIREMIEYIKIKRVMKKGLSQ